MAKFVLAPRDLPLLLAAMIMFLAPAHAQPTDQLVGYWPLAGDCQDHSGHGNHGVNHNVVLADGTFDGESSHIEVPPSDSLRFGAGDFTLSAWVHTDEQIDDAVGDVLDLYDPQLRRGITLSLNSSASGYLSQCADRHVYFGIDNARSGEWQDCGRPSPTSPYVANSMLVYAGDLYAATIEGATEDDWRHVYRYDRDKSWIDCGRVGNARTTGVGPLFVHAGALHAVTTTYDWTRVREGAFEPGHVFRYRGGAQWEDLGQVSVNRTLNCAASFQNRIYVGGGPQEWGVYGRNDGGSWSASQLFPQSGPRRCFPHASTRFNGQLFVGFPSVYAFDGANWTYAGVPVEPEASLQTHSFTVFQGRLTAGTWPLAKVAQYDGGERWKEIGRVGEDGTEVNSLVVYNGKLYGGSIPRAELCRYDEQPQWTSLRRFYSPEGWLPVPPRDNGGNPTREEVAEWTRITSLTTFRGRLFAGIGNCTSSIQDTPADIRGTVHSIEFGKCLSYDDELAPGWRHLTAVRAADRLKLYIDGRMVAESAPIDGAEYDLSTDRPLRIGRGQIDSFHGKIREVRAYRRALNGAEVQSMAAQQPD